MFIAMFYPSNLFLRTRYVPSVHVNKQPKAAPIYFRGGQRVATLYYSYSLWQGG